jgi:hypothetical protein
MLSYKTVLFAVCASIYASALPIGVPTRREVPQEHSHEPFLTSVRANLALNNPNQIQDPVFGLLGDGAAAAGAGKITNLACLQAATADQAFSNAKAANDVQGMVDALIFRAVERNTAKVGLKSAACTSFQFANPEIAAVTQHQDPASDGAAAENKAIVLELAKQIASVGGDPLDALKSGTFAPGDVNDATGAGNSCDDANDPNGCIFTQNLLIEDATADEISAAVAGTSTGTGNAGNGNTGTNVGSTDTNASCPPAVTVTVTNAGAGSGATVAPTATATGAASPAATTAAPATSGSGQNLQKFSGNLGGTLPPAVTAGGRGFVVAGSDDFLNVGAALGRSCDIQHNACANAANSGSASGLSVSQCDKQASDCRAAGN